MSGILNFSFQAGQSELFKRSYALTFGPPVSGSSNPSTTAGAFQYGNIPQNGQAPAPLKVAFDIERNMIGSSPNHSKIAVTNLSLQSRQKITQGYLVQLQAGYLGNVGTIFTGNVFVAKTERKDGSLVTTLECLDGGQSITQSILDRSYSAGITLAQILTDVAKAMGVNAGIALGIPSVVYNKGFVAHGTCAHTLDKLLKPQGLEWNVQSGNLDIVPLNTPITPTAEVVSSGVTINPLTGNPLFDITKATGLIGVPSQNNGFVQFRALLNPKLIPGALVQLLSENSSLNGFYKIRTSHFEGDSHDVSKWNVNCEAIPLPAGTVSTTQVVSGFNYTAGVA